MCNVVIGKPRNYKKKKKEELSHLSEGGDPLKRDVTIKTLHTQVFLQRIFLGNMQSPFTTTCIYPDMDWYEIKFIVDILMKVYCPIES